MGVLLTVLISVLPPVLFLVWILKFDRIEPEPFSSVLKILILGCLSVFPVAFLEVSLLSLPLFNTGGLIGSGLQSFLVIAPLEEAAKLLVVLLFVWRSRHFNEPNDGIVYTGTASIGFALAENLFYVFEHGLGVGVARALTSIPGHTFTGVLMGYYIGKAKFSRSSENSFVFILKGFLLAWLLHGTYDTFVLSGTAAAFLVIPLVALNFILGIKYLKKGRALSAVQWNKPLPERIETAVSSSKRGCGIVLGRTLLVISGLFWLLVLTGILFGGTGNNYDTTSVIAGSLMITVLPVTTGIILETSLGRKTRSKSGR